MKPRPPGLLRQGVSPDLVMMVCTAGHVDHGKTRLVKLLTGCATDRLKTEQERGMTIELGFAPCLLEGAVCVGIVDVPGHEKFVRTMVAGVSGIGTTILVVAADDGVMPQTVEHVQIMELLGLRHGIVALTKIDAAPSERVAEVAGEIRAFLEGTFLEGAPIFPLSSETGEGYFEFHRALTAHVAGIARPPSPGIFRMPVLKAFTSEGFGSVITGIPVAGRIAVGAEVEIVPGGRRGRIRAMQRFLRDAQEGGAGQCLALNIREFGKSPPARGEVLAVPGYVEAVTMLSVRIRAVGTIEKPLQNAEEVKVHTGTSEVAGKLYLLDRDELARGEPALAAVTLGEPVAVAAGDRCIIRRISPAVTVAGGDVLDVGQAENRPKRKRMLAQLSTQVQFLDDAGGGGPACAVAWCLASSYPHGATVRELSRGTLLLPEVVKEGLERLAAEERVLPLTGDTFVLREALARHLEAARRRVAEAAGCGGALILPLTELRQGLDWPQVLWGRVLDDLEAEGVIKRRGDKVILEAAVSTLNAGERDLAERIMDVYRSEGFSSPRPDELSARLGAAAPDVERLLEHLCAENRLVRLSKNVVLGYDWVRKAQELVVAEIREKGILNSGEFKFRIGSTRKYALAILDFLDARRVTMRIGNDRKLMPEYQKNLL